MMLIKEETGVLSFHLTVDTLATRTQPAKYIQNPVEEP